MRAMQITDLTGPRSALEMAELPKPERRAGQVLIEVHATGVAFPEVLQTRGMYQMKPPLPFVPGSEVAGVVIDADESAGVQPGQRVAAMCLLGGWADMVVAPAHSTFALQEELDFGQGAGLILNYHTAWFTLVTRGRLQAGETVLVHGAAGGVGTSTLQVARGLGARTIAVVSSDAKEEVARAAGADVILRSDGPWKDQAKELGGVDVVIDPVGGDRFLDSLRSLREQGRMVVVGFTAGEIPTVKVNRLLLNNIDVVGAAWGEYALRRPDVMADTHREVSALIGAGFVSPMVGARFPLERAAEALVLLDERGATGKVVLDVRPSEADG
ncbi:MAG TPA: NADPH:quinone oxidoreductase family protein [Mycobacteriales bacterium]|nr:NADPH:quinone oxidoreductase family protein [Mycobacteriales bacterium]